MIRTFANRLGITKGWPGKPERNNGEREPPVGNRGTQIQTQVSDLLCHNCGPLLSILPTLRPRLSVAVGGLPLNFPALGADKTLPLTNGLSRNSDNANGYCVTRSTRNLLETSRS